MKQITLGTTNPAKVAQIRGALAPIGVEVRGVSDPAALPKVEEDGDTASANARKKAVAYAAALGTNVLSMDNALYFEALPPAEQPGLRVRRIGERDAASDEEMLAHYAALVRRFGREARAHWEFAFCMAGPEGVLAESVLFSPRIFVSEPSAAMVPGYPLESIQMDPVTGQRIAEMDQAEQDRFWQREIGEKLQEFIRSIEF